MGLLLLQKSSSKIGGALIVIPSKYLTLKENISTVEVYPTYLDSSSYFFKLKSVNQILVIYFFFITRLSEFVVSNIVMDQDTQIHKKINVNIFDFGRQELYQGI